MSIRLIKVGIVCRACKHYYVSYGSPYCHLFRSKVSSSNGIRLCHEIDIPLEEQKLFDVLSEDNKPFIVIKMEYPFSCLGCVHLDFFPGGYNCKKYNKEYMMISREKQPKFPTLLPECEKDIGIEFIGEGE